MHLKNVMTTKQTCAERQNAAPLTLWNGIRAITFGLGGGMPYMPIVSVFTESGVSSTLSPMVL